MLKEIVVDGVVMGSVEAPDGWELVGYRAPAISEQFISLQGGVLTCEGNYPANERRWILRKSFVWPAWVKDGTYCAKDADQSVYLYEHRPILKEKNWAVIEGSMMLLTPVVRAFLDFPEIPGDWKDSLRQKPLEGK